MREFASQNDGNKLLTKQTLSPIEKSFSLQLSQKITCPFVGICPLPARRPHILPREIIFGWKTKLLDLTLSQIVLTP